MTEELWTKYSMTENETRYFDPNDEEITARIKSEEGSKVRAAINAGLAGIRPVYMITGLKIAKGFSLETSINSSHSSSAGVSAPITPETGVSVGAELEGSINREDRTSFRIGKGTDIIFAYQVHLISTKGWWQKTYEARVHSKDGFLGKTEEDVSDALEATEATKEDLEFDELEPLSLQHVELCGDGQDRCICILPEVTSE